MLIAAVSAVRLTQKNATKDGQPSVTEIFAAVDTDSNGELSLEEVLAWAAANAADNNLPTEPAFWEAQFAAADADSDNAVTPAELQAHLSNLGDASGTESGTGSGSDSDSDNEYDQVDEIMAAFDTNGDDVITKKEVRKVLRKQFKQSKNEIKKEFKQVSKALRAN
jgi:Ca2+-binding EF-hand superfamily protein